jgi:porin
MNSPNRRFTAHIVASRWFQKHLSLATFAGSFVICSSLQQRPARAEDITPGIPPATAPAPLHESPPPYPLTGDWFGLRNTLADHGIIVGGNILVDTSRNLTGGLRHDRTELRYLLDINATLDTEKALQWHGGTFFFDFQNHDGPSPTADLVGDTQGFDNMDAVHFTQIYQLWYQQLFASDTLRIKLGKIDANTDFSFVDHAREFFNASTGYSPAIFPMVTYPNPAVGGEIFFSPAGHFYAGLGAFYSNDHLTFLNLTGHPQAIERPAGGAFIIGEAGCRWVLGKDALPGHAALGGWGHTGKFANLTAGTSDGVSGFYAFADQSLFHDAPADGPTRDLGFFLQFAASEYAVSPVAQHFGGGLLATGLVPGRPNDLLGFGPTWVNLGDIPGLAHSDELSLEAFYKCQITPWFNLKPDLQFIRHPGGQDNDAFVVTLRVELDF